MQPSDSEPLSPEAEVYYQSKMNVDIDVNNGIEMDITLLTC